MNFQNDKKIKVLHFAPEKCIRDIFSMFKNVEYLSCDIQPNRAMCVEDITDISFKDNTFDIIFCSHVLEHIEDDKKAMSELLRVLKPKGLAILQVPFGKLHPFDKTELQTTFEDFSIKDPKEREVVFGQYDHVRLYEKKDFIKRLEKVGFEVTEEDLAKNFTNEIVFKYGLALNSIVYNTESIFSARKT